MGTPTAAPPLTCDDVPEAQLAVGAAEPILAGVPEPPFWWHRETWYVATPAVRLMLSTPVDNRVDAANTNNPV
jgi:hypothetical protein